MSNATLVFLSGSSQCGKTEIFNTFPDLYKGRRVIKTKMDFTSIREQLGNPSWEDLENKPEVAEAQQVAGLQIYIDRITDILEQDKRRVTLLPDIYLFERSPVDVAAYYYAFMRRHQFDYDTACKVSEFHENIVEIMDTVQERKSLTIYRPIDYSIPYDRRNNTRPAEHIRAMVDCSIAEMHAKAYYSVQELKSQGIPILNELRIVKSEDNSQNEIERLLSLIP